MRRVIGMDIHRTFAEVVFWEDGRLRWQGRVDMTRSGLEGFGRSLAKDDEVVLEATGNAMAAVRVLSPHVARVIMANPLQLKAIAHAHVKTDEIDAGVLASLHAAGFLPEVWLPDAETERRRRLVARRNQIVRHRTRVKNETHAILAAPLVPPCPHAELFNGPGRVWPARQALPDDERAAITRHLRELDRLAEDLAVLDHATAEATVDDPAVRRLLTVAGVNLAAGLVAAIGGIRRFSSPSGLGLARHGRISKIGRSHARALLVEAAWAAAKAPGPLHAFFLRIRARPGHQIAAVATARKMAVLVWHLLAMETDYLWARPALVADKLRALELQAGRPMRKGNKRGSAYAYNVKALRDQEMTIATYAERAYQHFVTQCFGILSEVAPQPDFPATLGRPRCHAHGHAGRPKCVTLHPYGAGTGLEARDRATISLADRNPSQHEQGTEMSEPYSLATEPEGVVASLLERFNSGKVSAMMTMYEPEAVFIARDGRTVTDHTEIAAELERNISLGLPLKAKARHVFVAGDIAQIVLDWSIDGTGPDGEHVHLEGSASDIVRRGADGLWRYLIDNPFGTAVRQPV